MVLCLPDVVHVPANVGHAVDRPFGLAQSAGEFVEDELNELGGEIAVHGEKKGPSSKRAFAVGLACWLGVVGGSSVEV